MRELRQIAQNLRKTPDIAEVGAILQAAQHPENVLVLLTPKLLGYAVDPVRRIELLDPAVGRGKTGIGGALVFKALDFTDIAAKEKKIDKLQTGLVSPVFVLAVFLVTVGGYAFIRFIVGTGDPNGLAVIFFHIQS